MKYKQTNIKFVYLIGIGGIGMSALARYFAYFGKTVAGYDRNSSSITDSLIRAGCVVSFNDAAESIPAEIINAEKHSVLVILTPAIPKNSSILNYFISNKYKIYKRSQVLGLISKNYKTIAVSGTHGKTSISTMIAHIFFNSEKNTDAILGGISKNCNSNLLLSENSGNSEFLVTEADEFDRSFLQLSPFGTIVTAIDADHLDIYSDIDDLRQTFNKFISQTDKNGFLLHKTGLPVNENAKPQNCYTYSYFADADFYPLNINLTPNLSTFDIKTPFGIFTDFKLQIPGRVNVENAVAAISAALISGINANTIRNAMATWSGVKRRFEYILKTEKIIYIDDYAHHPEEIKAFLTSVKEIYSDKKILGVFQPHLFSRTKDFAREFAAELSALENIIILEIYPAREEPLPGVTADIIFKNIKSANKKLILKSELLKIIENQDFDVLLTIGAGDIDKMVNPINELLLSKYI